MSVAKIGKRGTLIIPAEIRRKTGLKEGDDILIEIGEDGSMHMIKRPGDFTDALRGLYKEVWRGVAPETYVAEERAADVDTAVSGAVSKVLRVLEHQLGRQNDRAGHTSAAGETALPTF